MKKIIVFIYCICAALPGQGQAPAFGWVKQMGGGGQDEGLAITIDGAGNIYTTGIFSETVDFDPGPGVFSLSAAGESDVFISKMDAGGNLVWAKSFGGAAADIANSIAIDAAGNIYITGWFFGTSDFAPGTDVANLTSNGEDDIFITKLDAAGNLVWAKTMGSPLSDQGGTLSVDAAGNVYIIGALKETVDFDPGPAIHNLTSAGGYDTFILKLDAGGNFVWVKQLGGTGDDYSYIAYPNAAGGLYALVSVRGTLDMDPGAGVFNVTSNGGMDICIIKFDAAGDFVWAKNIGGPANDESFVFTMDANGNFYFTGYFGGTVDFDPGPGTHTLTSAGNDDMFVLKLDADFNFVWAKGIGGGMYDYGLAIDVDAGGNVYTAGFYSGTADFDPGAATYNLTAKGSFDIHITMLDAAGNYVWATGFGNTQQDQGRGIAVDAGGNVYVTGLFQETIDFNPGPGTHNLNSAGAEDIFVYKMTGGATGINNNTIVTAFSAYPNPGKGFFTLELDKTPATKNISVYDIRGSLVYQQYTEESTVLLNLQHLPAGIYQASILGDDIIHNARLIIE